MTVVGVWASTTQRASVPIGQSEPFNHPPAAIPYRPRPCRDAQCKSNSQRLPPTNKNAVSPNGLCPHVLPASGYRRLKTYAVSLTLHRPRFSAPPTIQKTRRPWLVARQSYPRRHAKSAAVGDEATKTNLRQLPRACRLAFGCLLGLVLPESPPRSRRERGP